MQQNRSKQTKECVNYSALTVKTLQSFTSPAGQINKLSYPAASTAHDDVGIFQKAEIF